MCKRSLFMLLGSGRTRSGRTIYSLGVVVKFRPISLLAICIVSSFVLRTNIMSANQAGKQVRLNPSNMKTLGIHI